MEYGEAISPEAADLAFRIGRSELSLEARAIHDVAAEAVERAYCVCVVAGEDAVEGSISAVHANLVREVEARLRRWLETETEDVDPRSHANGDHPTGT